MVRGVSSSVPHTHDSSSVTETRCPHCRTIVPDVGKNPRCPKCEATLPTLDATIATPVPPAGGDATIPATRAPGATDSLSEAETVGDQTIPTDRGGVVDLSKLGQPTPSKPGAVDPLIGKSLGGCRIQRMVGRGAMGIVYEAHQESLDRTVAVKTIRPELAAQDGLLQRFEQEARTIGRFNTPHVVQVYQVGFEHDVHFLVMEFVAGGSVRDYAMRQPEERITTQDAVRFMLQACEGLREAQSLGVLHRDIKPDNLILNDRGVLKIADFGIAKLLEQDANLTMTGGLTGTPLYMSPEQCRGVELDFRSDMWSLGASFYYLLSGKPPAEGSSVLELIQTKTKVQHLSLARALPDPRAAGHLGDVIERMTELEIEDRYASYDELIEDLQSVAADLPADQARQRPPRQTAGAAPAQKSKSGVLAAAVAVVILAGGGIGAWQAGLFGGTAAAAGDGDRTVAGGTQDQNGSTTGNGNGAGTGNGTGQGTRSQDPAVEVERPAGPELLETDTDVTPEPDGPLEPPVREPKPDPVDPPPAPDHTDAIAAYQQRLVQLAERFVSDGPESIAAESTALVTELAAEPEDFAAVQRSARALDRDVRMAAGIRRDVQGLQPPTVRLDRLDELANFITVQEAKAKAHPDATKAFTTWMADEIVASFATEKRALARRAEERLAEKWSTCQTQQREGQIDALEVSLRELGAAEARLLEIFPGADFSRAAPRDGVAALEAAVTTFRAAKQLEGEVRATTQTVERARLATWVSDLRATVTTQQADFTAKATGAMRTDGVVDAIDQLRSKVRFFEDLEACLTGSLKALAALDLDTAQRHTGAIVDRHRVEGLAEFESVRTAHVEFARGVEALFTALDPAAAAKAFDAANRAISTLRDVLPEAAKAATTAADYGAAARALATETAAMTPVPADRVAMRGGEVEVTGFFIDRVEVDRARVAEWLRRVKQDGDASTQERLRGALARLDAGEFDGRSAHPADGLTFLEAEAFLTAHARSMPRREEWLLAAIGPASNPNKYPWGDGTPRPDELNMTGGPQNVDQGGFAIRFGRGEAAVHHLAGNVGEWAETGSETKAILGGDFRAQGVQRREQAAGHPLGARATDRRDAVGFRGVLRPRSFCQARGLPLPR